MLEIPRVAHGAMAVAYVDLIWPSEDTFGNGVGTGEDKVVAMEIKLFNGQRHQWEVGTISFAGSRQMLNEGGAGGFALEEAALLFGEKIDNRVQVGLREEIDELFEDPFGPDILGEPLVDDGDAELG